jgi:hypothetical protein
MSRKVINISAVVGSRLAKYRRKCPGCPRTRRPRSPSRVMVSALLVIHENTKSDGGAPRGN